MLDLTQLFLSFFKVGLFGFGGGYAMVSLIQQELLKYGWMTVEEFVDVIAISEMTPGAIGINSATFVGFKVASYAGAAVAILGLLVPSFFLVLLLAHFLGKLQNSKLMDTIFKYLRPTVIALIFSAGFVIAKTSTIDVSGLIIAGSVFILMEKTKIHPILVILLAGFSGIVFYA